MDPQVAIGISPRRDGGTPGRAIHDGTRRIVGPSRPSVPAASSATVGALVQRPSRRKGQLLTSTTLARSLCSRVTVVSPPQMKQRRVCARSGCCGMSGRPQCSRRRRPDSPRPPPPPRSAVRWLFRRQLYRHGVAGRGFQGQNGCWRSPRGNSRECAGRRFRRSHPSPLFRADLKATSRAEGQDPLPKSGGFQQASDLGGGSRVGDAWPQADCGEVCCRSHRRRQRLERWRHKRARQLPTSTRESFPHPVHCGDVAARAQEQRVQVGGGRATRGPVSGAPMRLVVPPESSNHTSSSGAMGRPSVPSASPRPTTLTLVRGDLR